MHSPDPSPERPADAPRRHFAVAVSEALRGCGLPLSRVQARLAALGTPVSVATLSYWQSGRSKPSRKNSLRAVENLEVITGVPAGSLVDLVAGRTDSTPRVLGGTWTSPFLRRAMDALNLTAKMPVRVVTLRAECEIGPSGKCLTTRLERTLLVESGEVARLPLMLSSGSRPAPTVHDPEGFLVGEEYRDNEHGVAVMETLLPSVQSAGERFTTAATIEWGGEGASPTCFEWGLPDDGEHLQIGLTFAGSSPLSAFGYQLAGMKPDDRLVMRRELPVQDRRVEFRVEAPARGVYGIQWTPEVPLTQTPEHPF